ncbi:hypothetical protein EV182_007170, partial [Spiromyces aspiralis]
MALRDRYGRTQAMVLSMVGLGIFVDTVSMGMITPGIPDLLQSKLRIGDYANGLLYGCFGVILGAVTAGLVSDRYKSRTVPMVAGLLGLIGTITLFATANKFWELVVARISQGVASGVTWTIGLSIVADVVPEEQLGAAMGTTSIGLTLGKYNAALFSSSRNLDN